MIQEIVEEFKTYRSELRKKVQDELNKRKGLEFDQETNVSFLYPDVECIDSLELIRIDEDGSLIGLFEYHDGDQEEDVSLDMFLVEQLVEILEVLQEYEVSLG